MNLHTSSFFNSTEVNISSRMNEYLKKNFGYEVEGDFDTLQEAKTSLEAEQLELKDSYMSAKYIENMLMIETISSLIKAHGETSIVNEESSEFSAKQIKMAFGVLNDPRFKGGDFDGAVAVIEKIAKGLSDHPSVANALRRANESIEEDEDDGMLRRQDGEYDKDEIRAMQYQQNVADPLNREIDASQKAHTIEVDYDLELDKPKSKNPLLKKHYQLMKKFNVFISMPQWEEGPPDSGFGAWFADVRGSKENLKGWLKAWEYDYDERDYEDMGLEESMNEDEEAVAARDEFLKVMDMKPKSSNKAIDTIKKIVADKQNMQVKFDDGKMKVDLYTASAVSAVYDAVKPETKGKIDDMLRTKEGMLKMSNFAFSKLSEGIKEGKRIDEILPIIGAVAGAVGRAVVGGAAKQATKAVATKAAGAVGNAVGSAIGNANDTVNASKKSKKNNSCMKKMDQMMKILNSILTHLYRYAQSVNTLQKDSQNP